MQEFLEKELQSAIDIIQEKISEKQKQISLLENMDWTKPVTEKIWRQICDTPLRSSDVLLHVLVKNTFPGAEEISVLPKFIMWFGYFR